MPARSGQATGDQEDPPRLVAAAFRDELSSMTTRTSAAPPHTEFFPPPRKAHASVRWVAAIADDAAQLVRFWPVVQNMVVQELRIRYHRSMLGFLWTLLNPILMMATLTVVFSQLMHEDWRHYAVYLFAGMLPWGLLNSTLNDCTFCIIANEGLIRKIFLPKLIFPTTRLLINLTTFSLSMGAMFLLLVPLGMKLSGALVLLPVVIALFAIFALGLGLVVAIANTFYRDCSHLVSVFLQAWYFATPILYRIDQLKPESKWRFWLNPAYPFIRLFQVIIREGRWPAPVLFLVAAAIAAVCLGVGYATFKSYEDKLVFRL
jgi:ABC-2 type transport system permease protein/lipopolysaccharide transport system permease protein